MSETPRIVFTLFSAHTDSMVAAWQRFSADLLPGPHPPVGEGAGAHLPVGGRGLAASSSVPATSASSGAPSALVSAVLGAAVLGAAGLGAGRGSSQSSLGGVWRLLATNNREIARSVRLYSSLTEARADVGRICARRRELVVSAVVGPDRGTRGWYATLEGEPVITCSRWYETSSSSVAASVDAIEALQTAAIVDTVRTIESADRRRSRTRAPESSVPSW